jgi:hypothetical protein
MSKSILEMFEFAPRRDSHDEIYSKVKGDFPLLGSALVGNYNAKEKSGLRGATLMLFIDDDQMKFTLHHKIARTTLFGTLPDMVLSLEDIEKCLREGRFDTKRGG